MAGVLKPIPPILTTDVLVLGAGLAGMRAAWAASETDPNLDVTVVSQRFGPSGSSFANINDKLGMQVCLSGREREGFIKEAIAIAAPGYIDSDLVTILAEESEARFRELVDVGFPFDRSMQGNYSRVDGCFSPGKPRAFVFTGLGTAFRKLRDRFLSLGGRFLEGWLIQDLIAMDRQKSLQICGAQLQKAVGNEKIVVRANAVIVALGGPASLFVQNVGGPGTHGISHALLKRVGVKLVNTPYLQFLWHSIPSHRFWPIQACLSEGARIRGRGGEELPVPKELFELADERSIHCPVGYGRKDTVVDHFFIQHLSSNGEIDVFTPQNGWTTLALMAHAGNGGARIDRDGWTEIGGLYACGESAGGMHGANRIGGAMVTGTQVFGARAGKAAAVYAGGDGPLRERSCRKLVSNIVQTQTENEEERREVIPWLRCGMQEFAILGGRSGLEKFHVQIRRRLSTTQDWRSRLALEAACTITEEEIRMLAPPDSPSPIKKP